MSMLPLAGFPREIPPHTILPDNREQAVFHKYGFSHSIAVLYDIFDPLLLGRDLSFVIPGFRSNDKPVDMCQGEG